MRLKSYFAGTVESAMARAREELGPDAMLVQSKKATAETRHIGQYEVVFALADPEPAQDPPPATAFTDLFAGERGPVQKISSSDTAIQKLSAELAALKQKIEGIAFPAQPRSAQNAIAAPPSVPPPPSALDNAVKRLIELDVDEAIAAEIARDAAASGNGVDGLRKSLESRIKADATLGVSNAPRCVVALVGPPGAGKTTALVKLATRYGLSARKSMHLISTDVFRVGAAEQLRLYASILGVGFQAVETPLALAQSLEEHRRKDIVFIDTPGWANRDIPEIRDLGAYIADDPGIDVHLVLPVSNRACDIARITERYEIFRPAKLMFTRLDETARYGPIVNECLRTGKAISFVSTGEQIPEDLEPATSANIADLFLGREPGITERARFEEVD